MGEIVMDKVLMALWEIALYPSGGEIRAGTPAGDRDEMLHKARSAIMEYYGANTWRQAVSMIPKRDLAP